MKISFSAIAMLFAVCGLAQVASAQYANQFPPQMQYAGGYPAAYNGYGYYHHASTLEEGAANGIANLIHSAGAANLLYSQAARNFQEARSRALDNRVKGVSTYFELKKMNREYTASTRAPRPTAEEMARFAKVRAPERLSYSDLDPLTGRISWPTVLEDDLFQAQREHLDALMLRWVRFKGHLAPDEYLALQNSAKSMQAELKKNIRKYPAADYVKAKNMLESLAYEVVRRETVDAKIDSEAAMPVAVR